MINGSDKDKYDINMYEMNIELLVSINKLKINNENLKSQLDIVNKKLEEYKNIFKKLSPIAKCSYWNYKTKKCNHTCRGCDYLSESNPKTSTGILINGDRYCRLYKDGDFEENTIIITDIDKLLQTIGGE